MGTMIFHTVSITAFLASQVNQAPIVVQCAPPAPGPWWKWLLPTIVQTVVSLASITAGVWIAVASFRANKRKEHEQWVRDQKKTEWSGLLRAAAQIRKIMPPGLMNSLERATLIREGLKLPLQEFESIAAGCIFLSDFFSDRDKREKFYNFIHDADTTIEGISVCSDQIRYLKSPDPDLTDQQRENAIGKATLRLGQLADEITERSLNFHNWLRFEAAESIEAAK
ncbi:MAG TPA: hypothetical protein VME23_15055 [Terracidiphilus sp.]|nr:hypothetical protein [Terracidiphilus sp.]